MLEAVGSFSAIWLMCWLTAGLIFTLLYQLLRPWLVRLHPQAGSDVLLLYLAGPFVLSLLLTVFLFLPDTKSLLVDSHCHDDCATHAPALRSVWLASAGIICLGLVLCSLLLRSAAALRSSRQLTRQFAILARPQGSYQEISSNKPVVFTLGWWRPIIYISKDLLVHCTEKDLAIILEHEHAHRFRRDNLRLLAARIFSAGLPRALVRRMRGDLADLTEQACDFRAAERHGFIEVAEVLLKVQRLMLQHGRGPLPAGAQGFAHSQIENRVKALLQAELRIVPGAWQLRLLGVSLLLVLLLLVEPLHHAAEWLFTFAGRSGGIA